MEMKSVSDLASKYAPKRPQNDAKPLDPLSDTPTVGKRQETQREQPKPPISAQRSKWVNAAHIDALFAAFELEWGRKWTKQVEDCSEGRKGLAAYWLKRCLAAGLDEASMNAAMARLSGYWPPSLDDWIALCRPHTYEARVGHLQKYSGERPEPGEGYEQFKKYKERVMGKRNE